MTAMIPRNKKGVELMRRSLWVVFVLLLVGCGKDETAGIDVAPNTGLGSRTTILSDEAPGSSSAAAQQLILADMRGDAAAAWTLLHPAQQALTTQAKFTDCWGGPVTLAWESITIDRESPQTITAEGIGALNVVRTFATYQAMVPITAAYDWVQVDGHWRWVMDSLDLRTLEGGDCPFY